MNKNLLQISVTIMPTLKQYKEKSGKSLKNEATRRLQKRLSDDTLLLQGIRTFDPRINDFVDRNYIRLFSVFYGELDVILYLEKQGAITKEESDNELTCCYENMKKDLIRLTNKGEEFVPLLIKKVLLPNRSIKKINPVERIPDEVWDKYFDLIKPAAHRNADTYLQGFIRHWDKNIITCTCGAVFIAYKKDSKYCPDCKKKHAAVLVFRGKNKENRLKKECLQCHGMFSPKRNTGKFCSDNCRVNYHRKK